VGSLGLTIRLPRSLVEALRRRGVEPESFIVEAVVERLGLDPREELEARLEVAEYMLERAREELKRGDPVEASEKLYKAAEEAIKVLACLEGLEECGRARREGGWWSRLLSRAASRLSRILGDRIVLEAWSEAFDLHVHGFHEHSLEVEDVAERVEVIERLVGLAARRLRERGG
jgi:hypothetical protein